MPDIPSTGTFVDLFIQTGLQSVEGGGTYTFHQGLLAGEIWTQDPMQHGIRVLLTLRSESDRGTQ